MSYAADVHNLPPEERIQLDAAIRVRGLDPDDFLAEVVEYAPPDFGASIRQVALEVGTVRSLLWSDAAMPWMDRFRQQLQAGLFDVGGAARSSKSWDTLRLPFEVHMKDLIEIHVVRASS